MTLISLERLRTGFVGPIAFLAFGLFVSYRLLGGLLKARVGLVDENDIAHYFGRTGGLEPHDILRTLIEKTNIFSFGQGALVRPIYYVERVVETALWGTEGAYWYGWRIAMFGFVIAVMAWLYVRFAGFFFGVILIAYTLSFAMWVDIWTRSTGVSEQYTAFASAIFAIGMVMFIDRWRDGGSLRSASILMAFGAAVAMGSKENMLFLLFPLTAVLVFGLMRRRLDALSVVALVIAMAVGAFVASSVGYYVLTVKAADMYGNTPGVKILVGRLMLMIYGAAAITAVTIVALDVVIGKIRGVEARARSRRLARRFVIGAAMILAVVLSQQIVYSGQLPARQRYDFPALLGLPALIILVVTSLQQTATVLVPHVHAGRIIKVCIGIGLAIYTTLVTWRFQPAVAATVQRTAAFDSSLIATAKRAAMQPDWPIIVRSYNPWDFEIVQALGLWLVAKRVNNPRYLVHTVDPQEPRTPFEREYLDPTLTNQSRDGVEARGYQPFSTLKVSESSNCFVIAFRSADMFEADRGSQAEEPGLKCEHLPMRIYLEKGRLITLAPAS